MTYFSPLDQFDIKDLLSLNILTTFHFSITNIALYITIAIYLVISIHLIANSFNKTSANI